MKKFFTLGLILSACLPVFAAPKVTVMGAGKEAGTVTAYDLDGEYQFDYYSLMIFNGNLEGDVTEFEFNTVFKATDDETVEITNFINENADPVFAKFDAQNMTLTIPNGIDLGTLVFNPGQVNEASTKAVVKYYDMSTSTGVELDKDLVFSVDPEKRTISFKCKANEMDPTYFDECVYIMTPDNKTIFEIGSITFHYTNTRYTNNNTSDIQTVLTSNLYAEFDETEKTITLYNFSAEELWVYPTVFNIGANNTLVANKQLCMNMMEPMYFADKNGEPFTLTGKIQNADDGYDMTLSDYGWATETIVYQITFTNNFLKIKADIFGETSERPVIEPVGDDPLNCEFVTISHSDPEAEIFFTTDGSVPTENSTVYDSRIPVKSDSVIRAIAISDNLLPSHVATFDIKALGVNVVADETLEVSVENGRIIAPEGARAFNVNGMQVDINNNLPAGIYIVALNGKTAKVLVK